MANELPIPPSALSHPSVEMIRVWLANQKQQVSLNIGFWEAQGMDERSAWGILIADMIHHIADAHAKEYGRDKDESIRKIRRSLNAELKTATSERRGRFYPDKRNKK